MAGIATSTAQKPTKSDMEQRLQDAVAQAVKDRLKAAKTR